MLEYLGLCVVLLLFPVASCWPSLIHRLAFPLIRPAIATIAVYNALNVWNSFLFPLILTQSAANRVLPLSLWAFQGEFTINTPAILAAVVLSAWAATEFSDSGPP